MPKRGLWWWMAVVFFIVSCGPSLAMEWSDETRDVYVDGRLDRDVQVLTAEGSHRVVVVAPSLPRILVYDSETLEVSWLDKSELSQSDDPTASGSVAEPEADAEAICQRIDDSSYLITAGGHTVLVAPHQGVGGDVELADLWRTVPVWQRLAAAYEPDPQAVGTLRAIDRDVELRLAFGTWCGDHPRPLSQRERGVRRGRLRLPLSPWERGLGG